MVKEIEITVPFYDVDSMRVVYHGNYVKYLEEARCAFLLDRKMTYNDMDKLGYMFPVVEIKLKYIRPCVFGQTIVVSCILEECENCIIFSYVIRDKNTGIKLCKAETKQMCVDMKTNESLFEIPEVIVDRLRGVVKC